MRNIATAALEQLEKSDAQVPSVWWFEVRNSLVVNERRGRLSEAVTASFLRNLAQLAIYVDRAPTDAALLTLARQHRLSVYDAAYLELAQREGLTLATLDGTLRRAATAVGVPLLAEVAQPSGSPLHGPLFPRCRPGRAMVDRMAASKRSGVGSKSSPPTTNAPKRDPSPRKKK